MTEHSHALDLDDALDLGEGLIKQEDPAAIAAGLKQAAEASKRRKGTPLQSAMGMLTFYINRAGHHLPNSSIRPWSRRKMNCTGRLGRIGDGS